MKFLIGVLGLAMVSAPLAAQLPVTTSSNQGALLQSSDPKLAASKKLVFDFWREVFQTHDTAQAARYLAEDYIQHNPNVLTGRQARRKSLNRPEASRSTSASDVASADPAASLSDMVSLSSTRKKSSAAVIDRESLDPRRQAPPSPDPFASTSSPEPLSALRGPAIRSQPGPFPFCLDLVIGPRSTEWVDR